MGKLYESVEKRIKRAKKTDEDVTLCYATVQAISPLTIKLDNNTIIPSQFIVTSCLCREATIDIPFRYSGYISHLHQGVHGPTSKALPNIMLWRGLEDGDRVRCLKCNGGQIYYILEREDGIV